MGKARIVASSAEGFFLACWLGVVLEDGCNGSVSARVEGERTCAGGFDALCLVPLDEPEETDCRSKALFGIRPGSQDEVD